MAYNAFMKHIMSASKRQLLGGKERKEEQWEVRITDGLSSWKEGWGEGWKAVPREPLLKALQG